MFWLTIIIALWGLIHSLLASLGFKNFLRRVFGDGFMKFYRLLYNIFAVISITPVLYLMVSLPDKILYQIPIPWKYLMLAGGFCAAFISCRVPNGCIIFCRLASIG